MGFRDLFFGKKQGSGTPAASAEAWVARGAELTDQANALDDERNGLVRDLDRLAGDSRLARRAVKLAEDIASLQGEALDCFRKALEADPRCAKAWFFKAVNETGLGLAQDAAQSLRKYIELAPPEEAARVAKAREWERQIKASYGDRSRTGADVSDGEKQDRARALVAKMDPAMQAFLKLNEAAGEDPRRTAQALVRLLKTHGRDKLIALAREAVSRKDGSLRFFLSALNETEG